MNLRTATIDDLELVEYWDTRPHVIDASGPDDEWDWEKELSEFPEWREQLIAEVDGEPIGLLQIIDPQLEETHYWGEIGPGYSALDIWIGEEHNLGKGYGTVMMKMAFDRIFEGTAVHTLLIDPLKSNRDAHRFYERLGFHFVEERIFGEEDECFVYQFTRKDWDAQK